MLGELFECWSFLVGAFVDGDVLLERRPEERGNISQCGDSKLMGRNWTMTIGLPVEACIIETVGTQSQWDFEMTEGGSLEYVYSFEERGHGTSSGFL